MKLGVYVYAKKSWFCSDNDYKPSEDEGEILNGESWVTKEEWEEYCEAWVTIHSLELEFQQRWDGVEL